MRVPVALVDPTLPLPAYATPGATGFDFCCRLDITIGPREIAQIPANVIVRVPEGHVLLVTLRSSTPARYGLIIPNGVGVIDGDYCGKDDEIKILAYNFRDAPVQVRRGDRIAQGLLLPVSRCEWEPWDATAVASRGGFGSSGQRSDHPAPVEELDR